eukprot:c9915_g1_i1 orf=134-1240(+)
MAGASVALCSPATQFSQAPQTQSPGGDCLARPSSISRLCLTKHQLPSLLRLRTQAALSSSARLDKARLTGLRFDASNTSFRKLRLSRAASLDDSAPVSVKGSDTEKLGEDSNQATSDLSDFAKQTQDTLNVKDFEATGVESGSVKDEVLKAEAGQPEDNSESANKFIGVLRDTTEELKEQAEKARVAFTVTAQETAAVLAATAQETAERSKENLSYIAENAPDPIREIADTALKAHSADTPRKFAKIHDFCLGIPYGTFLVVGGLLWFIISGSTAAIRFGVILGGILLALSVSSLNTWKEGKPTTTFIQGQAVISSILAFREIRRLFEVKSFPAAFIALICAGMLGFYCYVLLAGGNPPKKAKHAPAA